MTNQINGLVELEKGMRAEVDKKTALTVLYRNNDMLLGLVGGKAGRDGGYDDDLEYAL